MSPVLARRLATAGTLTLALTLGSPVGAVAAPGDDGHRSSGRSDQAQERRAEGAQGEKRPDQSSADSGSRPSGEQQRGSAGERPAERDPRGNNGTVKIDGASFDEGRGNEPHVGCVFQVDFYDFDAGDTASITFTGQAPTGGGLLHRETATPISDDAAGGGQDRDAALTYSVDDQLAELLSVAPHPRQGWHVTLEVDVDSAPGGAKAKVFWIDCPQPAELAGTADEAATGGSAAEGETAAGDQPQGAPLVGAGTPVATFGEGSARVVPHSTGVSGTTLAAAEQQDELALGASVAQTVSARGSRLPSVLAFTGTAALTGLLALGLSAVGAGAAAHRLGRRRSADGLVQPSS